MPQISVAIMTSNNADTLEAACDSAAWADELVILVDENSSDETLTIAQRRADRCETHPWQGFTKQRQILVDMCKHDWVMILDGDETCCPQLMDEIKTMPAEMFEAHDLMMIRRRNYLFGRAVRAWWPDWQNRLMQRKRVTWTDEAIHDRREVSHRSRIKHLRGWLEHKQHSDAGFADYFSGQRLDSRLMVAAAQMHQRGKRCHGWDLLFRPWAAFVKSYFIKRGFIDGTFGLLVAQKSAISTQLKYAALWAYQQDPKRYAKNENR